MPHPASVAIPRATNGNPSHSAVRTSVARLSVRPVGTAEPSGHLIDIVEEWGQQSFPASDPPANW